MATADQKTALINAFEDADTDHDGHLTLAEITAVLGKLEIKLTPDEIIAKFKEADDNKDGKIQKGEWAGFCNSL